MTPVTTTLNPVSAWRSRYRVPALDVLLKNETILHRRHIVLLGRFMRLR
jgi:hypothetical protein